MHTEIKRWGNSAAVRLSSKLLAATKLEINSSISIEVEENKIIIQATQGQPAKRLNLPFDEKTLIAGLSPQTAHADEIAIITDAETVD